ncbi:MAG TPA: hypothetical protein V6D11_23345 [Waterburya sp.]|jgi:hypothetical protein
MPLGINLTLKIGQTVPTPAPLWLLEALQSVEVTHKDEEGSGFQLVFQIGRSGQRDLKDSRLLNGSLLKPFNRVVLTVTINAKAEVLMDGIITHQQFSPSSEPGNSTLTITGEDISVLMDLEEKSVLHPSQDERTIANQIISSYAKYGVISGVEAPSGDQPSTQVRIPGQQGTDFQYLKDLAKRLAYVFYIIPGPTSEKSTAYWGPPIRKKQQPQRALTLNMGPYTNLESINLQYNAMAATTVSGAVQDRQTNQIQPVQVDSSDRASLAKNAALNTQTKLRRKQLRETWRMSQARDRAQAITDQSTDNVVTITGEIDTVRYGKLLEMRRLVGLRGVGYNYDGLYYVKEVSHKIQRGQYKQSFTITREGQGTTIEQVRV